MSLFGDKWRAACPNCDSVALTQRAGETYCQVCDSYPGGVVDRKLGTVVHP